ncbi:putative UDP-3-O-acylglucosamine N-acyltransferase 2 [Citrus sinensis]|uniref:UDP-3-O-acylglucosamine N-acyltransferase 2 n=1 Tax=Citrus sinensis TaxID=2711 RepID=A0ACB8NF89_CITSI|nr:putative UDP-3-O-acylglucosamine N-acyltransferase 2 [Citrus sinensis]
MAVKRFVHYYRLTKTYKQDFGRFCNLFSTKSDIESRQQFQKWHNGGGIFHQSACIDSTVLIEVGAIVHSKAVLGANVCIGSGTVVGPAVTIGQSTNIGFNVALSNCIIGDSCIIHNGVCIGQDGFGFFVDEHGNMLKKPQLLNARIGNHVEIGANSCIDRGSWRDTVIGDHSKIDNLVQIGHNVAIGKSCMLCGQVGIAGSATSDLLLIAVSSRTSQSLGIMVASLLFRFMNGEDKWLTRFVVQRKGPHKVLCSTDVGQNTYNIYFDILVLRRI